MDFFRAFCSNTSIHGFIYTVQPTRHKIEKIFWFLIIIVSFIQTGLLFRKLILESQKNPTVMYTDQTVIPVNDLDFPAVTTCMGLQYKTACWDVFDYDEIKAKLESHERAIENFTLDELKLLQVTSLVARDGFVSSKFPTLKIPTNDFLRYLDKFNETFMRRDSFKSGWFGSWIHQFPVDTIEVLSNFGFCYTFNLPDVSEIYTEMNIHHDFSNYRWRRIRPINLRINRILPKIKEFPVKVPKYDLGLQLKFLQDHNCHISGEGFRYYDYSNSSLPKSSKDGYVLKIHNPYDVIGKDTETLHMVRNKVVVIGIVPKIVRTDSSLLTENVDIRNCYMPEERQLQFFKVYSKANCEHECLTQTTLDSCGCVQFFMARNETTKVCGTFDEKCFMKVEEKFEEVKSNCKCYDPCDYVKYIAKVQYIEDFYETETEEKFMGANIQYEVNSVFALRRKKSQGVVEFFSFVGGILGLFAGFSVISGFEIIYYFLMYPIIEIRKRKATTRVFAFEQDNQEAEARREDGNFWKFLIEILQISSVHSFSQIGDDKKGLLDRLTWIVVFIISIVMCIFMTQEVFLTYKQTKLAMSMESSPTKVEEIPFPAFTIVRDLEINHTAQLIDNKIIVSFHKRNYVDRLRGHFYNMFCAKLYISFDSIGLPFEINDPMDLFDILNYYYEVFQPKWFEKRNARWRNDLDPPFARTLTSTLYGYTFNMVEESKLLEEDLVSPVFHYEYNNNKSSTFPWKTTAGYETGLQLEVNMTHNIRNTYLGDEHCQKRHTLLIHSPFDLPTSSDHVAITLKTAIDIVVTPEIVKTDQDLRTVDIDIRNCYFDDERKLKFFKIYTQKNCEQECLSHIVKDRCDCVLYHFIRDSDTNVCDEYKKKACTEDYNLFSNYSSYDHLYHTDGVCRCLPQCNYIKYSYEIYERKYNKELNETKNFINVRWKDSEYFAMFRYQEMKVVDFLSYVGGILGLFAGVSVLSVVEIFYFLTLRLVTDLIRYFKH